MIEQNSIVLGLVVALCFWMWDMRRLLAELFYSVLDQPDYWPDPVTRTCAHNGYSHRYTYEKHKSGHARPRRAGIIVRRMPILSLSLLLLSGASIIGSQVGTPVGHKSSSLVGTPVGSQNSIKDGCSSTSIPQPSIPENQKCWTCSNEFGSKTIVWTHADPLPPPEPPSAYLAPHDFLCVPHSNCSETIDDQTPLDIETRSLGVHRGSNLSLSRELLSDDVVQGIVREVPS